MTNFNKASLKAFFEQGDVPTGTNYADMIDSQVNLVETALQSMAGPLACTELITPRVSSSNAVFGGSTFTVNTGIGEFNTTSTFTVSAGGNYTTSTVGNYALSAGGNITLNGTSQTVLQGGDLTTGNRILLGASGTLTITSNSGSITLQAAAGGSSNINFNSDGVLASGAFIRQSPVVVSAAGTTQGTAAVLTKLVTRGKGVVDGTTTGFTPLANRAGIVQYLFNEGASANLWPPVGGTINGLAANAAFSLAASAMVTIVHLTSSAMAVK